MKQLLLSTMLMILLLLISTIDAFVIDRTVLFSSIQQQQRTVVDTIHLKEQQQITQQHQYCHQQQQYRLSTWNNKMEHKKIRLTPLHMSLSTNDNDNNNSNSNDIKKDWDPIIRRFMGIISSIGIIETLYITLSKIEFKNNNIINLFCPTNDSCTSILNSQYSTIPGTNIPLSLIGLIAYSITFYLSIESLSNSNNKIMKENDNIMMSNRIIVTSLTTSMAIFSIVLISFLIFYMKESCMYCYVSALCSVSLATLAWMGNNKLSYNNNTIEQPILLTSSTSTITTNDHTFISLLLNHFKSQEKERTIIQQTSWSSGLLSFLAGIIILSSSYITDAAATGSSSNSIGSSTTTTTTMIAKNNIDEQILLLQSPPSITTTSSKRTIQLAKNLQLLQAKFYGAYWCGHCYEQKQTLGAEAMTYIPYIECSKDGLNSQTPLCKSKNVPGYPTWEINNVLYPGERSIDELEEIVQLEEIVRKNPPPK